jgi:hypothetical protein
MVGTVNAAIAMGVGTASAAIAMGVGTASAATHLLFGSFTSASWAIELCWGAGAVLAFGGAAYLLTKWWRSYGGRALLQSLPIQRWPDFKKWDERAEFELYEAAALWFDAEPRMPMWWRARQKFRRWKLMIGAGAILAEPDARGIISEIGVRHISAVTPHTRIRREELKLLAEEEGSKPLFLFPESRAWREHASAIDSVTFVRSVHARNENLLRKTQHFRALALLNFRFRFRVRSSQRNAEADRARLARIQQVVSSAIADAEHELDGLRSRLEKARESAALLFGETDNGDREEPYQSVRRTIEERLLVAERRIGQLRHHLGAIQRIESAVNIETEVLSEIRNAAA